MVERQLPKLDTRVRFPSPAPLASQAPDTFRRGPDSLLLDSSPAEVQAWIDSVLTQIDVPVLSVCWEEVTEAGRAQVERVSDVRNDEYPGVGRVVHHVASGRFIEGLRQFVDTAEER